jgi:hypothetical protein
VHTHWFSMFWQVVPAQQVVSVAPVQAVPWGLQPEQRSWPSAPGTHGARLQHWSRNWQMSPGWMQQFGSVPSQPVGQVGVTPQPKQRRMPFMSGLHTAFLPSQQFWEAMSPQMLPGGLHAPPLSQVWSVGLHCTHCEVGIL